MTIPQQYYSSVMRYLSPLIRALTFRAFTIRTASLRLLSPGFGLGSKDSSDEAANTLRPRG